MSKPPALAIWLLVRFGVAERNPPLMGDLEEAFRGGRSVTWFWRQTLRAVAAEVARRTRARYVAGIFIGWLFFACLRAAFWLAGAVRFRLYAGPEWFHWTVAATFFAGAFFDSAPWRRGSRPERLSVTFKAFGTFLWCMAIDWPDSLFWKEPVSSEYLLSSSVLLLVFALLSNWRKLIKGR